MDRNYQSHFCSYCGTKLDNDEKFCKTCGKPVLQAAQANAEFKTTNGPSEEAFPHEPNTERKTVYDGELHKCPNCGELLNSFTTFCPTCGYELRSVKANSLVNELAKEIEKASSVDEKIELITNFYVPYTREDIFDFFILAVSNLEDTNYDTDDAWRAKLEQTYHKARISFGNTPEFAYLEELYTKTRKKITKRERSISAIFRKNKAAFISTVLALVGLVMLAIGIILKAIGVEGGVVLQLFSMFFFLAFFMSLLLAPDYIKEDKKKTNGKNKTNGKKKDNIVLPIGKDAEDFYGENYDDMAEFLRANGFKNVVTKAERKGLLGIEGAIKGISVAGKTEFSEDDEFDVNSRIIIRYYSKKR